MFLSVLVVAWGLLAPGCRAFHAVGQPDEDRKAATSELQKGQVQAKDAEVRSQIKLRQPDISPTCYDGQLGRIVLVTVNSYFMDMFRNWYHYAKPYLSDSDHVVVVAEDELAESELLLQGTWTTVDTKGRMHTKKGAKRRPVFGSTEFAEMVPVYGSTEFAEIVSKRPLYISAFLKKGCTVLYTDVDMVWKSDPFRAVGDAGRYDLYVPDDNCDNQGTKAWYLCTGFFYLQPTPAVVKLMESWSEELRPGKPNQLPFNNALRRADDVHFKILPFEQFPPGCRAEKHISTAVVLHANWRRGKARKIEFLKKYGFWRGYILGIAR